MLPHQLFMVQTPLTHRRLAFSIATSASSDLSSKSSSSVGLVAALTVSFFPNPTRYR
jgi:hypothetical protein